jgi:hypothetical protein
MKRGLPRGICRLGIGGEIVIERDVLLKDDDQVLDWSGGGTTLSLRPRPRPRLRLRLRRGGQQRRIE